MANGREDPDAQFPVGSNAESSITRYGFRISTVKLPILKAEPIDDMVSKLGVAVPEMIFGDNSVTIAHSSTGWSINFNTFDALDRVDKTGDKMLQVAHSKEWQSTRQDQHEGINRVIKPFDWSYSTDYKGTVHAEGHSFQPSTQSIPLELLKRPDPILFFDEVVLYEDEMADNGITMLSCKIRVMPERLLLLVRFWMRLDGVLFRLRDTRIFVEFRTGDVIREYIVKEEQYETIREKLSASQKDVHALMRDPNAISDLLPILERSIDHVKLP